MRRLFAAFCLACLMGVFAGSATGDDDNPKKKRPDPEQIFKRIDTNNDGKISKEEFTKFFEQLAEKAGKAKGKEGIGEKAKEFAEQAFKALDTNNDGYISLEEWKKGSEQLRDKLKGKKKEN